MVLLAKERGEGLILMYCFEEEVGSGEEEVALVVEMEVEVDPEVGLVVEMEVGVEIGFGFEFEAETVIEEG